MIIPFKFKYYRSFPLHVQCLLLSRILKRFKLSRFHIDPLFLNTATEVLCYSYGNYFCLFAISSNAHFLPASHPIRQAGAFKKNFSSPLLTIDPLGAVREAPAAQGECIRSSRVMMPSPYFSFKMTHFQLFCSSAETESVIVDPVYEALRYGTSLAQMSRSSFGSISESPCHEV